MNKTKRLISIGILLFLVLGASIYGSRLLSEAKQGQGDAITGANDTLLKLDLFKLVGTNIVPRNGSNVVGDENTTGEFNVMTATQVCLVGDTCRTTWPTDGTGSQTPWTSNIDASSYDLLNLGTSTQNNIKARTSAGFNIYSNSGAQVANFGPAGGQSVTFYNGGTFAGDLSVGNAIHGMARLEVKASTADGSTAIMHGDDSNDNELFTILSNGFVGLNQISPQYRLDINGSMRLAGAFLDSTTATGSNGMVLQSTGTSTKWVATSSLGIGGAGGGTVTSVDMTVPTGLSVSGNPITTSGTFALTYTGGYSIPLTASTTEGSTAFTRSVSSWTAPLQYSAGTASITQAGSTTDGYLAYTDWNTFNNKADASAVGNKTVLYYWNASSNIAGYEMLRTVPNGGTEVTESTTTVANTKVLLDNYISSSTATEANGGLTFTSIPAGTLYFHTWAQTSISAGTNVLVYDVFRRASSGVETLLFSATSSALSTAVTEMETAYAYTGATSSSDGTDRFVVKVYAFSSANGRTITWYYDGTDRASHIETTFSQSSSGYTRNFVNETISGLWSFTNTLTANILNVTATTTGLVYQATDGTVSFPSYSFSGDTNTGMYPGGADTLNFSTGGTERMTITSLGRVGIGTSTPGNQLEVSNDSQQVTATFGGSNATAKYADFTNLNTGGDTAFRIINGLATVKYTIGYDTSNTSFNISNGSALGTNDRLVIDSTGNIGVGTSSPMAKLHITNALAQDSFMVEDQANDSTPFVITASGLVGIGLSSPGGTFHASGTNASIIERALSTTVTSPQSAIQIGIGGVAQGNGAGPSFLFFANDSAGNKEFQGRLSSRWENATDGAEQGAISFQVRANSADTTASTERMRLTSDGFLAIGTTSPTSALEVVSPASGNAVARFFTFAKTKVMEILDSGLVTLLGIWDFSGATVKQHMYSGITWPGTATTTTATTSVPIGALMVREQLASSTCWVTSGTGSFNFSDGTNVTNGGSLTTATSTVIFSSNNTFDVGEKRFLNVGPLTNAQISCGLDRIVNY